jgi:hypothetical protein
MLVMKRGGDIETHGYVGVTFEKSPVEDPAFTSSSVGIVGEIVFHRASAALSLGRIEAGSQISGNNDAAAVTGG